MKTASKLWMGAVLACIASAGLAQPSDSAKTPRTWTYELDAQGHRIARPNRVNNPDGSWREEVRQGNCVTVKERSATGEYRETRQCSSRKSG